MSTFSTKALPDRPAFALAFLEYLLTIKLADNTSLPAYSDAVKDLERMGSLEMQKLAMTFPNDFMVCESAAYLRTVLTRPGRV
jgi:exportin-5